jgi:hypothetical protein
MRQGLWIFVLMGLLLAGCAGPELRTQPLGAMSWETPSDVLPPLDRRYELPQALPGDTVVRRQPERLILPLDPEFTERRVPGLRFFIDSNGLPLIEMPIPTDEAFEIVQAAISELGWSVRRVNLRENRIEIDGREWLPPLSSQIFFRTPIIHLYLFTLGGGTQVHLEHRNPDEDFPISIQRELLEALHAELS